MDDKVNCLLLRDVVDTDETLLFNWVNDPEVRKWSFNQKFITFDEHKIWFKKMLNDTNILMWIFEFDNLPTGMVRLEKKDNNKVILNYLISSKSRGKGLASRMLKMAMNKVINYWENINVLAYTFPGNIPSIRSL